MEKIKKYLPKFSTQLAGRTAGGAFLRRGFPDCGSVFWSAVCHDSLCHHGTVPDPPCSIQLLGVSVPAAGHLRSPCPFRHDCHVGYAPFSALEFHHSLCVGFPAIFTIRAKMIFCQRHDIRIPAIYAAGTKGLWRTAGSGAGLLGIPCHCTEAVSLFTAWQKAGKTYQTLHTGLKQLSQMLTRIADGETDDDFSKELYKLEDTYHRMAYQMQTVFQKGDHGKKCFDMLAVMFQRSFYLVRDKAWQQDEVQQNALPRLTEVAELAE